MNSLIPVLMIFILCFLALSVSLFFRRRPLEKRCSSEPEDFCRCHEGGCGREHKKTHEGVHRETTGAKQDKMC